MIPKYHIFYYKNHAIYYLNGIYKVGDLPTLGFLTSTEAMKEIDKVEDSFNNNLEKFFDNLKQPNDQNGLSEKISK